MYNETYTQSVRGYLTDEWRMPTTSLTEWYIMFFTCGRGQRSIFIVAVERAHLKFVLMINMSI